MGKAVRLPENAPHPGAFGPGEPQVNIVTKGLLSGAIPLLAAAALAGAAAAQTSQQTAPNMPESKSTVPEKIDPPQTSISGNPGQSLSDKLERSGGVITPQGNMDSGISKPAPVPDPGTTPIIRPPGEPGGNPNVQPK